MKNVFFQSVKCLCLLGLFFVNSHQALSQPSNASNLRFTRGAGTDPTYQSFVIPLDGELGVTNTPSLVSTLNYAYGVSQFYHLAITNSTSTNRIAISNAIAAFGSRYGGSTLFINQNYHFGGYAGAPFPQPGLETNGFLITEVNRTNGAITGDYFTPPAVYNTNLWAAFLTNGAARTYTASGLTTTFAYANVESYGDRNIGGDLVITHQANASARGYEYTVWVRGYAGNNAMVTDQFGDFGWSPLYTLDFDQRPATQSAFVSQPQFTGTPMPSTYEGASLAELLAIKAVVTNTISAAATNWLDVDDSPELRQHPILDQFVADMGSNALALASYVQNEIELTDAIAPNSNTNVPDISVNLGGVNRGALGVFLEGQGSPVEQCALLIYLLRRAGVPAAFVYAPHDGVQMLDTRLSQLLRMQLHGAVNQLTGQPFTTNTLISVNYPWVAAYIGGTWVHLFPWLKNTEVEEGLNLYDYMPTNYNSGNLWTRHYLQGDTNIFSLNTNSDLPSVLFPAFVKNALLTTGPGISIDDLGTKAFNRRVEYAQWSDFPTPFAVTNGAVNTVSNLTGITNIFPTWTNIFDTVSVQIFSLHATNKFLFTGDLRTADLHDRKFLFRHQATNSGNYSLILSLAPYRPGLTNSQSFTNDASLLNQETLSMVLTNTDDPLTVQFIRKSNRTFPAGVNPNSYLAAGGVLFLTNTMTARLGDLGAICLNPGNVSKPMLATWAQEYWNMQQQVAVNPSITNSLSPDITQGTLPYLMGLSFYERVTQLGRQLASLHKANIGSVVGIGLSKLSAERGTNGTLFSPLTLYHPNVDMYFNTLQYAGNGTLRPDDGADFTKSEDDFLRLYITETSAQEHQVIDDFYRKQGSISTVRLLRQAQQTGQPGILELNVNNYTNYTNLASYDSVMWQHVVNAFTNQFNTIYNGVPVTPNVTDVFITQKPVTNNTANYQGMAAMVYDDVSFYAALISGTNGLPQNGGYGPVITDPIFNNIDFGNITLDFDTDDNSSPSINYNNPTVGHPDSLPPATSILDANTTYINIGSGATLIYDPTGQAAFNQAANVFGLAPGTATTDASVYSISLNGGAGYSPQAGQDHSQLFSTLLDPVNAVTGEFYIDDTDLVMPGPMPLVLRRNYSSQNLDLGDTPFGSGWRPGFQPYLSVVTNYLICATEMDGTVVEYRQVAGTNYWKPLVADNPQLNNHSSLGMGSTANPFNNYITNQVVSGVTNFYLRGADGSLRTFQYTNYPIPGTTGTFNRNRPYLQSWQDASGNGYAFAYQTNNTLPDYGQVHRIQSSNGDFVVFDYDTSAHIVEVLTGDGREFHYDYDNFGDLTTVTLPDQSQINYVYQHSVIVTNSTTNAVSTHLITQEQRPNGRVLANTYDSLRRVIFQAATVGADLSLVTNGTFVYSNNVTSLTNTMITGTTFIFDVFGHTNIYQYANNLITGITDPLGQTISQTWFSNTNDAGYYPQSLKSTTDKRGLTTSYQYDGYGNLHLKTLSGDLTGTNSSPDTATWTYTYYTNNLLPQSIVDPNANTTYIVYDSTYAYLPRYITNFSASGYTFGREAFSYTSATDGTNSAFGLLALVQRQGGTNWTAGSANTNEYSCVSNSYNAQGFLTSRTRFTSTVPFDTASSNDNVLTFLYDERGEMVQQTDAAGRSSTFTYDPMGRPTGRETYEAGQNTAMDWTYSYYNENGDLVWTDGARYNPEDYIWRDYDGNGRKIQEIHWRSQANTDGSGISAAAGYGLYATTFFQYDPLDDLTNTIDPLGNSLFQKFDALCRLTQQIYYGSNGVALATNYFAHEPGGLVSAFTNALGAATTNIYTSTGKLKFQRNLDGSTHSWVFDLTGRAVKETLANGNYWQTIYNDGLNRITNIFNNGSGPLATNITQLDMRGNVLQSIDALGNAWTNLYDGLDRLKFAAGPDILTVANAGSPPGFTNFVTNILQKTTAYFYDNSGKVFTVSNAMGETTVTTSDAIGRPIQIASYNSNSVTPARVTSTFYSPDHNSVTVTNGTGTNAIVTTTYTDTFGHPLLSIGYPASGVTEFTWWQYDAAENCLAQQQCSSNASGITVWATNGWTYDGLNRVVTETARDGAVTTYSRDALGDVTNRAMPGSLKWIATYLNDGRIASELETNGGLAARSMTYTYYPTNSSFVGRLKTVTDGRSTTRTNTYDDFMRLAGVTSTGTSGPQQISTTYQYDLRNLLTNLTQSFSSNSIGPSTTIVRGYDAYGRILDEVTSVGGSSLSTMLQTWDAAGRRSQLNGVPFNYQADGLMIASDGSTFGYANNGLLASRTNASRVYLVTQRDGRGRVLNTTTKVGISTPLSEALSWRNDGRLTNYVATRSDFTDTRNYAYSPLAQRLTQETLTLGSGTGQKLTNSYTIDSGSTGGLGILTSKTEAGAATASWTLPTSGLDGLSRLAKSQNSIVNRPAYGIAQGAAAVTATLDGGPVALQFDGKDGGGQWRANLDMSSGSHTLSVSAVDPSGLYAFSSNSAFTVASNAVDSVTNIYDGNGNITQRTWTNNLGQTIRTEILTWDAFDRLIQETDRDTNNSGFNFVAVFDGLGRRIRTIEILVTNGVPIVSPASSVSTVDSWYDPQVEFLETAVNVNGIVTVKTYGPDASGVYGGMQGVGGMESIYRTGHFNATGSVQDYFGNIIGTITNSSVLWNPARFSSYGPVPGYQPLSLSLDTTVAQTLGWRGLRIDPDGDYHLGTRRYGPVEGRFLSADPLGHSASMDLYSFCGGDPVNHFDADGRIVKGFYAGFNSSPISGNASSAFMSGYTTGGVASGFGQGLNEGAAIENDIFTFGQIGSLHSYASTLQGGVYDFTRGASDIALLTGGLALGGALYETPAIFNAGVATANNPWTFVALGGAISGFDAYQQGAGPGQVLASSAAGAGTVYIQSPFSFTWNSSSAPINSTAPINATANPTTQVPNELQLEFPFVNNLDPAQSDSHLAYPVGNQVGPQLLNPVSSPTWVLHNDIPDGNIIGHDINGITWAYPGAAAGTQGPVIFHALETPEWIALENAISAAQANSPAIKP